MATALRAILQERKELKDKEIFLVEEHQKEIGLYVLVFIRPAKVSVCKCPNYQFKSSQYIYRFGYAYLVSDKLSWVGTGCHHYNYPPSQDELNRSFGRFLKAKNRIFFEKTESYLEQEFEQAFGAT
jgi:hypothetical protein